MPRERAKYLWDIVHAIGDVDDFLGDATFEHFVASGLLQEIQSSTSQTD